MRSTRPLLTDLSVVWPIRPCSRISVSLEQKIQHVLTKQPICRPGATTRGHMCSVEDEQAVSVGVVTDETNTRPSGTASWIEPNGIHTKEHMVVGVGNIALALCD